MEFGGRNVGAWLCLVMWMSSAIRGALGIRNLNFTASSKVDATKLIIPAVVVFGDSTVDAGNNNYIATIVKADFAPYGMNFDGHVPTGRFTDGLLTTDFVSLKLGLPFQLPYLSPQAHGAAILTGVNFASSASGWFENTANHFVSVPTTLHFLVTCLYDSQIGDLLYSCMGPSKLNCTSTYPTSYTTGTYWSASGMNGQDWVLNSQRMTLTQQNVKGLATQLTWFQNWKAEVLSVAGPEKGNFIISNALYAFSTGTNDWVNNYDINPPLQKQYTPEQYTSFLLGEARKYVQELYSLGGRNIAILSLPPLGCIPAEITLVGRGNPGCVMHLNDIASYFNDQIPGMLADMKKTMPGSRLILIDIFSPIYNAFQDPQKYGFKYARDGCCGTGDLEVSVLCNKATPTCSNPDEHIFWDSFHPTSHFYSQLADSFYDFALPILLAPPSP